MAASKDITKVAVAGTAVIGIIVILYFLKKKSRPQDDKQNQKPKISEDKMGKAQNIVKEEQKPDVPVQKPKTTESKIPQKIQSKPQNVVKASASESGPVINKQDVAPSQDISQAGGEQMPAVNSAPKTDDSKLPEKPTPMKIELGKNVEAPPEAHVEGQKTKSQEQQPIEANQQLTEAVVPQQEQTPPPLSVSQRQPDSLANDSPEISIKSQASIVLTPQTPDNQNSTQASEQPSTASVSLENTTSQNGVPAETKPLQNGNGSTSPVQTEEKAGLDVERITKAIQQAKTSPASVDRETIDTLVMLLKQKDIPLLQASLDCIVRCGAFSQNQSLLRESGCIQELTLLLSVHAVAARTGVQTSQYLLGSINNAIINLCMDIQNQARLEVCIPVLIDLITYEMSPEDVQLMSLKSLTNLSTTPSYHDQYIVAIPRLFTMMDGVNSSIRLQAVKVLVNLSCNPEIIPDLLEAKAPSSLMKYLEPQTDSILLLRVITLLVNLVSCVKDGKLSEDQLPSEENPPQPGSIYSALFGDDQSVDLKMRVQGLTRHSTDNVSKQAIRLFEYIK